MIAVGFACFGIVEAIASRIMLALRSFQASLGFFSLF
jgi:hypothetical protein